MEEKYFVIRNYDEPQIEEMDKESIIKFLEQFTKGELDKRDWDRAKIVDCIIDQKIEDYNDDIIIIKGTMLVPEIKTNVDVNIDVKVSVEEP